MKNIGIVGAGQMGNGIAQVAAGIGINVVMYDINQAALDKGLKTISSSCDRLIKKEIFKNIQFPEGHVFEDMFLISDFAKLLNKVFISENGCYYYYHRENSITTSIFTLQKNIDHFTAQFKNYKMLYSIDSLKKYRVIAYLRVYRRLLTMNKEYPQYDNKKEIKNKIKK